ncbi:MAG TPA: 50S ribosomal protein L20 [Candidatus Andersenbacteria bacterium]|nr:50S ribosomal protein L20 [Candidatus Andersenbacteria bacterium]
MARASRSKAKHRRHKKWRERAAGFRGTRRTTFKKAKEAVLKAGQYAYRDRRVRKTVLRSRWQQQINAAVRQHGLTYSRFIHALRASHSTLDRKIVAQLATTHPELLQKVIESVTKK